MTATKPDASKHLSKKHVYKYNILFFFEGKEEGTLRGMPFCLALFASHLDFRIQATCEQTTNTCMCLKPTTNQNSS